MTTNSLPAGMVQVEAPVVRHERIARDHYLLRLRAPVVARRAQPGQFVHVQCSHRNGRRQPPQGTVPLLRRPFSLLDVDPDSGTIDFIYKVVGLGTAALAEIPVGAKVDLLGPLGHPFEIPSGLKTTYLVGGGVGIPPLYLLAKWLVGLGSWVLGRELKNRPNVVALLGARTKDWLICSSDFRKLGVETYVATDDGTLGHKGSVVDLMKASLLKTHPPRLTTAVYICGPTPMMASAAALAKRHRLSAQVSLEERMGCAMGCCLGCVVEIATEPKTSHSRFQRVCTEGPVFPAESIAWKS